MTHAHDNARLDSPVGYWNVLALMMVMGIAIVLAVAGDRAVAAVSRVLAVAGGVVLAFTFFFTLSRGGWVVLLIALFLYFAFTPTRLASFAALLAIAVPVGLVLFKVRHLGTLFTATDNDALRTLQGHALLRYSLAALLVAVGAQTAIALVHRAVPWPRWARAAAGVAVIGVLVLGVGGGSWRFLEARGGMTYLHSRISAFVSDSDQPSSNEGAVRLVSMNTGRPPLWREALDQSRYDRLLGTGAGTFVFTHYRFRTTGGVVRHAHSEWFNVLSELGVVGLVLLVAAMVLLVAAALGNPFAGRDDPLRPALVALQAGIVVFVVHISWDWDWDMAAAGVTFFFLVAVCLPTSPPGRPIARSAPSHVEAAGALAAATAGAGETWAGETGAGEASGKGPWRLARGCRGGSRWGARGCRNGVRRRRSRRPAATPPRLYLAAAQRRCGGARGSRPELATAVSLGQGGERGGDAAGNGETTLALAQARHAASFDPLAVDPLIAESLVLQQLGQNHTALQVLNTAARLQPNNYEVYYGQGVLLLTAYGRKQAAIAAFKHALALNPLDSDTRNELAIALGS